MRKCIITLVVGSNADNNDANNVGLLGNANANNEVSNANNNQGFR